MTALAARRSMRAVNYIPIEDIVPSPMQPRQHFSIESLEELRDSIMEHGILQPLTVRTKGERFELIAGERRLRAAALAGLQEVPCVILEVDMEESGILALVENIQRKDLDYIEEAEGISRLVRLFGLSQEQAARHLGKSQSAIANKLRILRLGNAVLERLRETGLTERHARALLRLPTEEQQLSALDFIIDQRMNVAAAEEYIEKLTRLPPEEPKKKHGLFLMGDVRLFMNTIDRGIKLMRSGGVDVDLKREETEEELVLVLRIPKQ